MADSILLNNKKHHFNGDNLPCLIHYLPKEGGSHFSITMVVDLFLSGSKILFFSAYPMAKDNFLQQVKGEESKVAFIADESKLDATAQVIILESGNEELFLKAVEKISDINDRVVLVKNVEFFSEAVVSYCLKLQKIIISGNIDKCVLKKQISKKQYKTIVLFSKLETLLNINSPELEKYQGYLWSNNKKGLVSVRLG